MPRRNTGRLRRLALTSLGLIALVAVALALVSRREARTLDRWESVVGDPAAVAARFPDRPTNATARRLEELAAELGIALEPTTGIAAPARTGEGDSGFGLARGAVKAWVYRTLGSPGPEIDPPPGTFEAFRVAHRGTVDEIVALLGREDPPVWERELMADAGARRFQPGHVDMQLLLAGEALARHVRGESEPAGATLDAAYILNGALREEPELIDQILATTAARLHAGLLRRLAVDPATWRARLAEHDYGESYRIAAEMMGWLMLHADVDPSLVIDAGPLRRAWWWLRGPYDRLCRRTRWTAGSGTWTGSRGRPPAARTPWAGAT